MGVYVSIETIGELNAFLNGKRIGLKLGIKGGVRQMADYVARVLVNDGLYDVDRIAEITGTPVDEIMKMKKED